MQQEFEPKLPRDILEMSRNKSFNISEGMLRGTDNFYFILITFSVKLELVLINRVI